MMTFSFRNLYRSALMSARLAQRRTHLRSGLRLCVEELEGRITPSGPTVSMPGSATINGDASFGFSSANHNAITVADPSAVGPDTVLLQVTRGTLYLATTAGLTSVGGNGSASVAMTGTLDRLNAALNGLTYVPEALGVGDGFLSLLIDDNALPTPHSSAASTDLAIVQGNFPPTVNGPVSQETVGGIGEPGIVFSTSNGNAITVNDRDNGGGIEKVVVQALSGSLTIVNTADLASASGNGTHMLTLAGTIAALNKGLDGLLYQSPTSSTSDYLNVLINDNGNTGGVAKSAVLSMLVVSLPEPPPPAISVPAGQDFNLHGVTFSAGNGNAIHISNRYSNGISDTVLLQVVHGSLTVPSTGQTGSLIELDGAPPVVNAALDGLQYTPSASAGNDFLSVSASSPNISSNEGLALTFYSSDTLVPVLAAPGPHTVTAGNVLVFSQANQNGFHLAAGDANGADEIVIINVLYGRLRVFDNIPGVAVSQSNTSSLLLTGTIADLNAALDGLQYGAPPGVTADLLSISFGNNGSAGGSPRYAVASLPIAVT